MRTFAIAALALLAAGSARAEPDHAAVATRIPRGMSRPRAVVAREIVALFRSPLAGEVRYRRSARGETTRQEWSDSRGNRRVLVERAGGGRLLLAVQDGRLAYFGRRRDGRPLMGERSPELAWSLSTAPAPGTASVSPVPRRATVGIVGPGAVGTSAALEVVRRLKQEGVGDVRVVLVGRDAGAARGRALEVAQAATAAGLDGVSVVGTAQYRLLRGADAVVIAAGAPRKPGQSRSDLVAVNAGVVRSIAGRLARELRPRTPVLVVTNPLDAMTYLAGTVLDPSPAGAERRVLGMAGALDGARLERSVADLVARKYRVPASRVGRVQATVVGVHGDEMVPLLSRLRVDGVPAARLLGPAELERAVAETRAMGATVTKLVGQSAYVAPGACIARMVSALVTGRGEELCASVPLRGAHGLGELALGVPVRLGKGGATLLPLPALTPAERVALERSAAKVREDIQAVP
jgi:malate dehydrogenase